MFVDYGKFVILNGGVEVGYGFINCVVFYFEGVRFVVWVFWEFFVKFCVVVDSVVVVVGVEDVGVYVYFFFLFYVF